MDRRRPASLHESVAVGEADEVAGVVGSEGGICELVHVRRLRLGEENVQPPEVGLEETAHLARDRLELCSGGSDDRSDVEDRTGWESGDATTTSMAFSHALVG